MYDTSKAVGKTPRSLSTGVAPIRRGLALRLWQVATLLLGLLTLTACAMLGEYVAERAVESRERLIGSELAASIDRILSGVVSRHESDLAALAGRPCDAVWRPLVQQQTYVTYIRTIALVANGRAYCSSGLGPIDVPLAPYLRGGSAPVSLNLLRQTQFQPGAPVIVMYRATAKDAGILYVVDGQYIADTLAHGVGYGAQHSAFSVAGAGRLTDRNTFLPAEESGHAATTQVSSSTWPFSVQLVAAPGYVTQTRWKYGLLFGAIGVLVDVVIAALYLLAFAPRRLLLSAVQRGLRQGDLYVVYQPIVDMATRSVIGVEALLRWQDRKWGAVSPAVFMPEVESSALLASVTRFMLHTAVAEMGRCAPALPLRIAVNIAPKDLERKGFVAEVLAVCNELPKGTSLVLELTERFLLMESPRIVAIFDTLKAHGVRFAIDDFGTQHSNLDLLSRFPFDFVKIDRQFVRQVDTGGVELITGIVSVARHFGMQVIAEGVESESQHAALRDAGVPYGQGYLYQRPLRAHQLKVRRTAAKAAAKA
ncbi:cyclic diguanylate phosphodiesterase [Paraburkholderia sp. DHOC27]|uniref:EAL domain-containing protein n=1 Tax=Paraburkholderia sp. DHOC27 TaxID=2303330 RepID=UPI000E3EB459|nr:cyclic diguanylate phosphodiesterase [Paraburkholderia sp. DHOC27]RFU49467.1 cyclic diguanylate phosphodiesterase [Paraburkholderia sp. DHOC27]